jgi:hypothetical protein
MPTSAALVDAAHSVDQLGASVDQDFAGSVISEAAGSIKIYRTAGAPGDDLASEYCSATPDDVGITYGTALLTKTQVDALNVRMTDDLPKFTAEGVRVTLWGQVTTDGSDSFTVPFGIFYDPAAEAPSDDLKARFSDYPSNVIQFLPGGAVPLHRIADMSTF